MGVDQVAIFIIGLELEIGRGLDTPWSEYAVNFDLYELVNCIISSLVKSVTNDQQSAVSVKYATTLLREAFREAQTGGVVDKVKLRG